MPVDFASYLLSSSPTGSSLELLNCSFSPSQTCWTPGRNGFVRFNDDSSINKAKNLGPLKPIIIRSNSFCDDSGRDTSSEPRTPTPPSSPGRLKKRVSFADHNGLALATVRIMTEPSHMPPRLRPEILSTITQGASAGVTEQPPLRLNFSQPACDYLAFRDRINKDCVSLENVILRDYNVLGTVKVKNISFEKNVFLRFTLTKWDEHEDVTASYVAGPDDVFDTFSFEFEVPTTFDRSQTVEFAVCYEANSRQYWDNNYGTNYIILPVEFRSQECLETTSILSSSEGNTNPALWTEFGYWNKAESSTPYW